MMDIGALATAFVGAQVGEMQLAIAAKMLRMNAATAASAVKLIDAAQANFDRLANVASGVGSQSRHQRLRRREPSRVISRAPRSQA
jgi:hypothetical protein